MKNTLLLAISLMFVLQSCGQKQSKPVTSSYGSKVVLGAFNDMTSASTFNEEALTELPRNVNFSSEMTSVKNQGHRGTCTFFAATALLEAALKMDKGIDVNLSEEYLMYSTKAQGNYSDIEASHVSVNLQSIKEGGILLEKDLSYRPSWFSPGRPCADIKEDSDSIPMGCFVHAPSPEAMTKIIPAKSIKTGFIRKNTNEVIKFLANKKRPLSISLPVNFKGWGDDGNVTYNEELRQDCLLNPKSCGAHSVVLTGYDLDEKVFYFKNSWGNNWGDRGFGRLSFELVDKFVDGYVYYARVDGEISLPEGYDNDHLNLEDIKIKSFVTDTTLNVDVNIKMPNINGRYVEVQNYLASRYMDEYGDFSTDAVVLSREEQVQLETKEPYVIMQSSSATEIAGETLVQTSLPQYIFNLASVQEIFTDPKHAPMIFTGITLYTDLSDEPIIIFRSEEPTPIQR